MSISTRWMHERAKHVAIIARKVVNDSIYIFGRDLRWRASGGCETMATETGARTKRRCKKLAMMAPLKLPRSLVPNVWGSYGQHEAPCRQDVIWCVFNAWDKTSCHASVPSTRFYYMRWNDEYLFDGTTHSDIVLPWPTHPPASGGRIMDLAVCVESVAGRNWIYG